MNIQHYIDYVEARSIEASFLFDPSAAARSFEKSTLYLNWYLPGLFSEAEEGITGPLLIGSGHAWLELAIAGVRSRRLYVPFDIYWSPLVAMPIVLRWNEDDLMLRGALSMMAKFCLPSGVGFLRRRWLGRRLRRDVAARSLAVTANSRLIARQLLKDVASQLDSEKGLRFADGARLVVHALGQSLAGERRVLVELDDVRRRVV